MVLFDADLNRSGEIINEELDLFFGKNFIVTHHKEQIEAIDYLKDLMPSNPKLFENSTDYLLYLMLDRVIDSYLPVMDSIDNDIDMIENEVMKENNQQNMNANLDKSNIENQNPNTYYCIVNNDPAKKT